MTSHSTASSDFPGDDLDIAKMPGHWLLARLGKRVLRPGGLEATEALIKGLMITSDDEVVEFAPGLGSTARRILALAPKRYVGVERDPRAIAVARNCFQSANVSFVEGIAEKTGLPDECASVVIGEAMLTMNPPEHKKRIVQEAQRLLRPSGRYGIHELCIVPSGLDSEHRETIESDLSSAIRVGARPLQELEWRKLLENAGFVVTEVGYAPMHLLRLRRLIGDEGLFGAIRIAKNILTNRKARKRVYGMRELFERHQQNLNAIYIIAEKTG
ncbi:class I SAM-dependent methyltransferase [Methyloligella solikamskensis]|uniref:Class I SAM-dependent methyltransferase n=1 Tax=Methyloligella solikamskensis TaxID=1177756 RepID=A0ABW3J767_9HYPH